MKCVSSIFGVLGALTTVASADESAETGAFLPLSESPASPTSTVKTVGSYDAAEDMPAVRTTILAKLTELVQVAGALVIEKEEVSSEVSGQLSLLDEDKHSLDLQLAAGWDRSGVNNVRTAFAALSAGRTLAGTYVLAGARFDLGLEQDERGGGIELAAVRPIGSSLYAGVDSRLGLDFERDAEEPMNEATWSLRAAPALMYSVENVTFTGSFGLAAERPRDGERELGVFAAVGMGASL